MPSTVTTIKSAAVSDTEINSEPSSAPLALQSKNSLAKTALITKQNTIFSNVLLKSKYAAHAAA